MSVEMRAELEDVGQLRSLMFDSFIPLEPESDFGFRLQGQSINPMIDAVTPLLGLVQRVRQLTHFSSVSTLYARVVSEIQAVELALGNQGYVHAEVLSFR